MPYNFWAAPNFNTWAVPVITGVITLLLGKILLGMVKKYLRSTEENHELRSNSILDNIASLDRKLTAFCKTNHDEHEKANVKLINHDHDPDTGKPRFYV